MNQESEKALIRETIKELKQEEKKEKNRVYHNTELLMKNYNELKQHAENAVYELRGAIYNDTEDMDCDMILVHIMTRYTSTALCTQRHGPS